MCVIFSPTGWSLSSLLLQALQLGEDMNDKQDIKEYVIYKKNIVALTNKDQKALR